MKNLWHWAIMYLLRVSHVFAQENAEIQQGLTFSVTDLTVMVNQNITFWVLKRSPLMRGVTVTLVAQHTDLVKIIPTEFTILISQENYAISVLGVKPGRLEIISESSSEQPWLTSELFLRIIVANSEVLEYMSIIFGWVYFAVWSISFYPQIYMNYSRKSVVGLNFDFLAMNVVGFSMYSIFNIGLYWVRAIQEEYTHRHPRGLNPVLLNDVIFSLHAILATVITIFQCFIYERANQRVSKLAFGTLCIFALVIIISSALTVSSIVTALDFLYICSYIKLTISIIKYAPQGLMNYHRKSTTGWCIGNILLDLTGGVFSVLQMIINAYNYDDWVSIFGDPTKFGMGTFSVLFDVFFMLQHFVFYRKTVSTVMSITEPNAQSTKP